ncbi:Thioredoxin-like fold [Phaffia rhodozyma]|uniref:Thioredoxin-like fold n=1 Tax=Phaffia rhodozyma TaxID=264483 RepID=A0A0F7SL43_PHARH|nr:Thioredoxin-like fold [Phaffia rhodozyma]
MSLKPSLTFQRVGSPSSDHTLEIFIDYQCGRAKAIVQALNNFIVPHIKEGGKLHNKLSVILRLAPQNWFAGIYPPLYDNKASFLNVVVQDLSATQIRKQAAELAKPFTTASVLDAITNKTHASLGNNGPNTSTPDLQYNIKYARQLSIQHTPSVALDGIIQGHVFDGGVVNGIPSSWGQTEWDAWVEKEVLA